MKIEEKLENLIEIDDVAFDVLQDATHLIFKQMQSPSMPHTSKALFVLTGKILTIKAGLYDLMPSKGIYTMSIVLRSLIEHYLRFQYIFMVAMETSDDFIGKKIF